MSLGALGCILHAALPSLPRWRLHVQGDARPYVFWDNARGTVRLVGHERGCFLILDSESGCQEARYDSPESGEVIGYEFSPDGRYAVEVNNTSQNRLRWIDLDDNSESFEEFEGEIHRTDFSPAGKYLALGISMPSQKSDTLELLVLDCKTRVKVLRRTVPELSRPVFLPGERYLVSAACNEEAGAFVVDLEKKSEISQLPGVCPLYRLSADGTRLLTERCSVDDLAALWDISDPAAPRRMAIHMDYLAEFTQDGSWCAGYNLDSEKNELWDVRIGTKEMEFGDLREHFVFSPDSRYLGYLFWPDDEEVFQLIDLQSRRVLWSRPICSEARFSTGCPLCRYETRPAFTPNSRFVIIPGVDAAFDVVAASSGELVFQFAPGKRKSGPPEPQISKTGLVLLSSELNVDEWAVKSVLSVDAWLEKLFGKAGKSPKYALSLIALDTRQELLGLQVEPDSEAILSPDGHALLITEFDESGTTSITCWDIRARRPWRWILGIPLGLLAVTLSARWLLRLRQRRKPQAAAA
ncbi:MAG: WD40 repeat domain-containing protein [Planctomycetes bacterium]|nr:WD40 repeat domain-containing protein [Planctomycetota bacterium]